MGSRTASLEERTLVDDDDVFPSELCEMIGDATPCDSCADDDCLRLAWEFGIGHCWDFPRCDSAFASNEFI